PVTEATGAPYASKTPGVMHACGHDIHMSSAIGALRVLRNNESAWNGRIVFVAQPAEEIGVGARAVLADRTFQSIMKKYGRPEAAIALHDFAESEAGTVGIRSGWAFANVDSVDLFIYGRGGHGARPHQTVDPVVIGSEIVVALQTIVSRRLAPGTPAVVTVGAFNAGTKHNIISSEAHLQLTVRSYGDEMRAELVEEIKRIAGGIAEAHRAPKPPRVEVRDEHTPAAFNDEALSAHLLAAFGSALGEKSLVEIPLETVGEDFGRFAKTLRIPGVQYRLGGAPRASLRKTDRPGLHSDRWLPEPTRTLKVGMLSLAIAAIEAGRFVRP
ncbi:MAG: amidohydrolase, partial [Myxococcota bacterium]